MVTTDFVMYSKVMVVVIFDSSSFDNKKETPYAVVPFNQIFNANVTNSLVILTTKTDILERQQMFSNFVTKQLPVETNKKNIKSQNRKQHTIP